MNLKSLVPTSRLTQQTVKLGKDIHSDHDILEQESIKPSEKQRKAITAPSYSSEFAPDDPHKLEPGQKPTTKQLIEYKKQIRLENDRRAHRQQLADLAKKEREKFRSLQPDPLKPVELHHQQYENIKSAGSLSGVVSATDGSQSIQRPIAASREEEEILNEEDIFQPRRQRVRDRERPKTSRSRSNTPLMRKGYAGNLGATMRAGNQTSDPLAQFGICKVCGNKMGNAGDQLKRDVQQVFSTLDCLVLQTKGIHVLLLFHLQQHRVPWITKFQLMQNHLVVLMWMIGSNHHQVLLIPLMLHDGN